MDQATLILPLLLLLMMMVQMLHLDLNVDAGDDAMSVDVTVEFLRPDALLPIAFHLPTSVLLIQILLELVHEVAMGKAELDRGGRSRMYKVGRNVAIVSGVAVAALSPVGSVDSHHLMSSKVVIVGCLVLPF